MADSLFPAAPDGGEPLVSMAMTQDGAERFMAALGYAAAVLENMAEANKAPATRTKIREHAEMLNWGRARLFATTSRERGSSTFDQGGRDA